MLPKGWTSHAVQEMGAVHAGRQRSPDFKEGKPRPYLRVANVFDGRIDTSDVNRMPFTDAEFQRYKLEPGDILLNEGQSLELVGRPAMYEGLPEECGFQNTLIRFKASEQVDPSFALARFQQCLYDGTFQAIAKRTTSIAHLGVSRFAELVLTWPPLDEQRKIVKVLACWDHAVTALQKLLANSQRTTHALIGQVLMPAPSFDGKSTSGDAFPPSVQPGIPQLPATPEGWRKTSLAQHLCEVIRPAKLVADQSYRLVTVRRSRGGVDERSVLLGSEIKTPTQFYVKSGDFLISKRQIVHGACGIVPPALDGAIVSNEYAVLNTTDDLDPRFLRYLSETAYFQQTCFHSSVGVHVEKMLFRLDKWLKWPINLPPLEEQQRIVRLLDTASEQEAAVQKQLGLLKEEKKALMQDLLTGKRRVKLPSTNTVATPP